MNPFPSEGGGGGEGLSIYLNIVRMMHTRMDFTFWK